MKQKENREFTCDCCGGIFSSDWTEEEKISEKDKLFPGVDMNDMATTCHDCFIAIMDYNEPSQKRYLDSPEVEEDSWEKKIFDSLKEDDEE